jgi:pseudouridine kinase
MTATLDAEPRLLGIGGAHIDRRGQVTGLYIPGASNPGTMREDIGGVVFNALRNARQLQVDCALMSLRGGDAGGERIARAIADARIEDRSAVFLDRATASYTALIDRDGELIAGFADMGLYDLFPRQLRRSACRDAIARAGAVLCDANLPAKALELVCDAAGQVPVHAIGISPVKVLRLAGLLDRIACLYMNRKEALALAALPPETDPARLIDALRGLGLRSAIVTDGGNPVMLYHGADAWMLSPPSPRRIVDVTGAGDALAGATVAATLRGKAIHEAARHGLAAAMLALESADAVPAFDGASFGAALALVPPALRVA